MSATIYQDATVKIPVVIHDGDGVPVDATEIVTTIKPPSGSNIIKTLTGGDFVSVSTGVYYTTVVASLPAPAGTPYYWHTVASIDDGNGGTWDGVAQGSFIVVANNTT